MVLRLRRGVRSRWRIVLAGSLELVCITSSFEIWPNQTKCNDQFFRHSAITIGCDYYATRIFYPIHLQLRNEGFPSPIQSDMDDESAKLPVCFDVKEK